MDEQEPSGKENAQDGVQEQGDRVDMQKQQGKQRAGEEKTGVKGSAMPLVEAVAKLQRLTATSATRPGVKEAVGRIEHPDCQKHGCR